MSSNNNNLNDREFTRRHWPSNGVDSFENEATATDSASNGELQMEPGMGMAGIAGNESNHNSNSPISPVMLETFNRSESIDGEAMSPHALLNRHSNWRLGSSPASSVLDDTMEVLEGDEAGSELSSESELDFMFEEEQPPIHGIRFYNPNYRPPGAGGTGTGTSTSTPSAVVALQPGVNQVNSRLDLRPVPASIDLTRNQPSINWRAYHARVRASTAGVMGAMPVVQRLCAGNPSSNVAPTPMVYDSEFDAYVYYRNDTDSEEEPALPPLAMVPRRGNSVSDLSQCSSDYEPEAQLEEPRP
ncbi:hypothetical protein KR222_011857 [Zaprionus bogoriensis]|nr:hypothetical protein KR222_011857 [Zaprionus bogoriensis]